MVHRVVIDRSCCGCQSPTSLRSVPRVLALELLEMDLAEVGTAELSNWGY